MRTTCAECGDTEYARGLCTRHYQKARYHGQLPDAPPKTCEVCGQAFTSRNQRRRFCSATCKETARTRVMRADPVRRAARAKVRETRAAARGPCRQCGQPVPETRQAHAVYCSDACKTEAVEQRRRSAGLIAAGERRCLNCGKLIAPEVTLKAKCCSRECGVAYQNQKRAEAQRERVLADRQPCRQCGGEIPESRRGGSVYCSTACKRRAKSATWRERSPGYMREYLYGVTPEQYEAALAAQGGRCAICRSDQWPGKGNRPHTDHDHADGRFRGILCGNCNHGLGMFGDDPARLRVAAEYLERVRA